MFLMGGGGEGGGGGSKPKEKSRVHIFQTRVGQQCFPRLRVGLLVCCLHGDHQLTTESFPIRAAAAAPAAAFYLALAELLSTLRTA